MPACSPWRIAGLLAAWTAGTLGSLAWFWQPEKTAPDLDELYWIGSSYYHQLAWVQRDWASPDWALLPARENPPVAKYALGLGLALAGRPVTDINLLSYFYAYWAGQPGSWGNGDYVRKRAVVVAAATPGFHAQFRESGRIPLTPGTVMAARRVVLVSMVLASLLLLLLGLPLLGGPGALLASQLLLLHPVLVFAYNHAMADAVALLFSIAAALVVHAWFQSLAAGPGPRFRDSLGRALLAGTLLALACGAKMNSLVLVFFTAAGLAVIVLRAWLRHDPQAGRVAAAGAVMLGWGLVLFVAINPAIVRDPLGGLAATVVEHQLTALTQAEFLGGHLTGPAAKLQALAVLAFFGWLPLGGVAVAALWCAVKRWSDPGFRFILGWWLTALVCTTLWLPFAFSRYVVPVLPPTFLLLAYAVNLAARSLRPRAKSGVA